MKRQADLERIAAIVGKLEESIGGTDPMNRENIMRIGDTAERSDDLLAELKESVKKINPVLGASKRRGSIKDKEKALKILYTKLYNMKLEAQAEEIASTRKNQVGSGDRSEKIRTYNYPQSRVTDHRINKTIYSLGGFLNGDIDCIVDDLIAADTAERLKGEQNDN